MVQAEELRAQIRATRRPDSDLAERRQRVQQVFTGLRRQLDVVGPKIEQLIEMRADLRERPAPTPRGPSLGLPIRPRTVGNENGRSTMTLAASENGGQSSTSRKT